MNIEAFLSCIFIIIKMSIELGSTFPTLPKTERGKPLVINGDPKGKNFLYCNGNSVIIRNIEVSRLVLVVNV